jgi:signal transduction histidine kinase
MPLPTLGGIEPHWRPGGAGLDLVIVAVIARGHGGHAEVASPADRGAGVWLLLAAG